MKKPSAKPAPRELARNVPPTNAQLEQVHKLGGQIQNLAIRLEALRSQGFGDSPEFKNLEQILTSVQDKLMLAEAKIRA